MKRLPTFLLSLFATGALAGPVKITVQGGETDQTNAIVTFDAPKDWAGGHYVFSGRGGTIVSQLQVNADGKAVMIVLEIGKGETINFLPTPAALPVEPYGIKAKKAGKVLRFVDHEDGMAKPLFDYQMEAGDVPEGMPPIFKHGAHLHPVYSPSGRMVTGNHPADHPWHRGLRSAYWREMTCMPC